MIWLYGTLALAAVFAIAAVVVGREARRLDAEPPAATFDLEEATEWVGNHLPVDVSSVLSYDDVRRIIEWNLEYLRARGLSSKNTGDADGATGRRSRRAAPEAQEVYVDQAELAHYVQARSDAAGAGFTEEQVVAVLDAQFGYFDAIGAIGPQATPDEGE